MHHYDPACGCLDCGFRRTASAEIARQSRSGVSEAVPEAKTGVQSDSGAGIGLPEPSATKQVEGNCAHCGKEVYLERDNRLKKEVWFHRYSNSQNCAPTYAEPAPITIPNTIRISLPALRAVILAALDGKTWLLYEQIHKGHVLWGEDNANEERLRLCDEIENQLRELQ